MNIEPTERLIKMGYDPLSPRVPVDQSIGDQGIVCLFDGVERKDLTRHLRVKYGVTPEQYRSFWNLPDDYPMTSASLMRATRADIPAPRFVERRVLAGHAAAR